MKKRVEYTLPEWAFIDSECHEGNPLGDRTVILHIRSASVIEIIDRDHDGFHIADGVLSLKFKNSGISGDENLLAVLHYCETLQIDSDRQYIIENILKPCAKWYGDYCDWEDDNMTVI